jgi:hypothetical protein
VVDGVESLKDFVGATGQVSQSEEALFVLWLDDKSIAFRVHHNRANSGISPTGDF